MVVLTATSGRRSRNAGEMKTPTLMFRHTFPSLLLVSVVLAEPADVVVYSAVPCGIASAISAAACASAAFSGGSAARRIDRSAMFSVPVMP